MTVTSRIHPSALLSPEVEMSPGVVIGPYCVLEGKVRLGPGCVLRPMVHLVGPLTLGSDNLIHSGAVLGEWPQHLKYRGEPTSLEVGDGNCFGEGVTIHRAATPGGATRIGNGNLFLPRSHLGHDCEVQDGCTFGDNSMVGGHAFIGRGARLGDQAAVHQFGRMGRLSVLGSTSIATKDIPPFIMQQGVNAIVGVNTKGMHRGGMGRGEVDAMLRAYTVVYQRGLTVPAALEALRAELGEWEVVREFVEFVRDCSRGISTAVAGGLLRKGA